MLEPIRHLGHHACDPALVLPIDKNGAAKLIPLADNGPASNFLFRDENDWKQTAKHDPVDIAHVIGDDHITASLKLVFIANKRDSYIEDLPQ